MFRSLRFRLPLFFLAGIALDLDIGAASQDAAGLVATLVKARGIDPWDLRSSCRGGELPRPGVESPNVDRHAGLHELDDKTAHMEPDVR